jgi:transcriptional regulator NrdR family protein
MQCPYCFSDSIVVGTANDTDFVVRRRRCNNPDCRSRFFTIEKDIDLTDGKALYKEIKAKNKKEANNASTK